jgi:hypothetical protein
MAGSKFETGDGGLPGSSASLDMGHRCGHQRYRRVDRLFGQGFPFFEQLCKPGLLVSDPVGGARLVSGTGESGSLLDKLTEVIPDRGDALIDLSESCGVSVGHGCSYFLQIGREFAGDL